LLRQQKNLGTANRQPGHYNNRAPYNRTISHLISVMLRLAVTPIPRYIGSVNAQPKPELTRAFRQWQLRQKSDGSMVSILALITLFPVINFLASPSANSAMFLGLFLFVLGMACRRLLISAAKLVEIRNTAGLSHSETQLNSAALDAEPKLRPLPLDHWSTGREYLN
jgi:hypothetical protein